MIPIGGHGRPSGVVEICWPGRDGVRVNVVPLAGDRAITADFSLTRVVQ
jgi:hypothetical protein